MKKKTGKKVTRTMPTRSNKGGSMRGKERAAYVKGLNSQSSKKIGVHQKPKVSGNSERKAAMPAKASKKKVAKKVGKKKATRLTGLAKARSVGGKAYGKGGKNNATVLSTPTTTARRKTTRKMPLLGRIRKMRRRMGR